MSESQLATTQQPVPSVALMLQAVIDRGVTGENVEALDKLCGLYERMEAKNAEKEFAAAFTALQADTPNIHATKIVPGNDGNTRYKFAPYEEIMRAVQPMLKEHGFAITFDSKGSEDGRRVTVKCTLMHRGGHSRTNEYTGRVGDGPPKSSEAQKDGAAYTYAKRFALCAALNITVEHDTDGLGDARNIGEYITPQQAEDLIARCRSLGLSKTKVDNLLAWLTAKDFSQIPANRLADIQEKLDEHEAKKTTPAAVEKKPSEPEWELE